MYISPDGSAVLNTNGGGVNGLYLWEAQLVKGYHNDGGPLITTTSAAASIGANKLSANLNPITTDRDFIWWVAAVLPKVHSPGSGISETIANIGGTLGYLARDHYGVLYGGLNGGEKTAGIGYDAGRYVLLIRHKAGKNTVVSKKPDGTITMSTESSSYSMGSFSTEVRVGNDAGSPVNGPVEFMSIREGAFTDLEINAIVEAA
jgi:hypothetical protein